MSRTNRLGVLMAGLAIVSLLALGLGEVSLMQTDWSELQQTIFWQLRLPRVLLAAMVGALLAVAGVLLQVLFRNPLAEPSLIGISSASALGAVLVIVLAGHWWQPVPFYLQGASAFAMAVLVALLIYRLSKRQGQTDVALMLLLGVALNAFIAAWIALLILLSTDTQLRTIAFWSLGSFSGADWPQVGLLLAVGLMGYLGLRQQAPLMNAYLLGEPICRQMGFEPAQFKWRALFIMALMVGASVALVGGIGFVGLIVPHIMRLWVGNDHRLLLPASALGGALVLVLADTLSRTLWAPMSLPVGLLMALVGGPFFLWMLLQKRNWHD